MRIPAQAPASLIYLKKGDDMARVVNVEEAASWDEEEASLNLTYLETRGRLHEANRVRELRSESGAEKTGEFDLQSATVGEVIDWVGEDPDRAAQAYSTEQERPSPRKGVLDFLTENFEFE